MTSDLEKDKAFRAPADANALSRKFDDYNGDMDTPEEVIRAFLENDTRAFELLRGRTPQEVVALLETIDPELRRLVEIAIENPALLQQEIRKIERRNEDIKKRMEEEAQGEDDAEQDS